MNLESVIQSEDSQKEKNQYHVLMHIQRVLHTLAATQKVPRHTRLHSRGSTRVPPTFRGSPWGCGVEDG